VERRIKDRDILKRLFDEIGPRFASRPGGYIRILKLGFRPGDGDVEFAARYLPPPAVQLFLAMPRYDQQHARNVCHMLQRQGHADRDLLAAALLHDAGKSIGPEGRVRLWHRVAVVLFRVFWPGLLGRLAKDKEGSWRRPFYVQVHHAAIGAEAARQAGCSDIAVGLIRHHEDTSDRTPDPLLAALQAADSEN
jgi:hypothetical protein